ncbi:3881_t:CDS:2 [Funneliformis geosporum]|uniref:3881_t:CDS:1 n=1 Tax=Funneliformis geosporum TaxID=1117311 RepID=A0A9W4WVC1_9GLOM|nr:3881_t:CDS:2 [Funneliformis geosporum]
MSLDYPWYILLATKPKNLLSGCVFYQGQLDEDLVQLFYKVPGVIRFLDHSGEEKELPSPLSPQKVAEFSDLLKKIKKKGGDYDWAKDQEPNLQIGDWIKVIKGPYIGCQEKIIALDEEKKLITVNVDFFGRLTPAKILMTDCIKETK